MATPKEVTVQIMFRLPVSLIKRLDQRAKQKRAETGMGITRTDVVRNLLTLGLQAEEKK